jgi:hypothetical protein
MGYLKRFNDRFFVHPHSPLQKVRREWLRCLSLPTRDLGVLRICRSEQHASPPIWQLWLPSQASFMNCKNYIHGLCLNLDHWVEDDD